MSKGTEIAAAFNACNAEGTTVGDVIDQLQEHIIDQYNRVPFETYKSYWVARVVNYAKSKSIPCVKSKINWNPIATGIINKFLVYPSVDNQNTTSSFVGFTLADDSPSSILSTALSRSPTSVSCHLSSSTVESSVLDSSDITSVKLVKLNQTDKEKIKNMYAGLDRSKMWKLSTGTIVEDKMKDVAMSFDHEHPSHSLILDVDDSCWVGVFNDNERAELRGHRSIEIPDMSDEAESYLRELADLDELDLYAKVEESGDFKMDSDSKWIQKSYRDAFRLLKSDFFPLQSQTEGNVVKRVWSCLDSCFDFSGIKCVSGEKCSRASADAGNRSRSVSNVSGQFLGRKMDYLFTSKKTEYEVGCGECALIGGVKTTKELYDGSFKMPKVMKDMANSILSTRSGLSHDLCIADYYIGETGIQLFTLDFPAGYVARLDCFGPVYFPKVESEIPWTLPLVLRLIMGGRQLMENSKAKIEQYKGPGIIAKKGVISGQIVPTFMPTAALVKKRKMTNDV